MIYRPRSIALAAAFVGAALLASGCQSARISDSREGPSLCIVSPSGPGRYLKESEAGALEDDMASFWLLILAAGVKHCGWGLGNPNIQR